VLINDIIQNKEEISMAAALLQEISQDEKERAVLRSRRLAEMDRVSEIRTSEIIGEMRAAEKWQAVVAEKDAKHEVEIANSKAEIENLRMQIAELKGIK